MINFLSFLHFPRGGCSWNLWRLIDHKAIHLPRLQTAPPFLQFLAFGKKIHVLLFVISFWWLHGRRMMWMSRHITLRVEQKLLSSRETDWACLICSRSFTQVQNLSFEVSKEVSLHNQRICEENHGLDVVKHWYFN